MEQKDYRRALGSFPTGVTIVTAFDKECKPWGLTANSFTSVSLDPPVISVCIAKTGRAFTTLASASRFAVNILAADQQDLAMRFASKVENRFDGINITEVNDLSLVILMKRLEPQKDFYKLAKNILKVDLPEISKSSAHGKRTIRWIRPDTWIIESPYTRDGQLETEMKDFLKN